MAPRNETRSATTFAPEIAELGDRIAGLTLREAVQLKDYLKEKHKIEPASGGVMLAPRRIAAHSATRRHLASG